MGALALLLKRFSTARHLSVRVFLMTDGLTENLIGLPCVGTAATDDLVRLSA